MVTTSKTLTIYDGETLMDMRLEPTQFCVETLLPQGVCMLGCASKIGKSWMVLDLCVKVAKGEPFLGLPSRRGTTLYLCLEDTLRRVQDRLNRITDEVSGSAFFATSSCTLEDGLQEQIENFTVKHPDTILVVVDTFQIIRSKVSDSSYANDYEEVRKLKELADKLGITILLVHHIRKMSDTDPFNKLSGTTGLNGAMDTIFILDRSRRDAQGATLFCTGRDISYRQMELRMTETCLWEVVSDSMESPEQLMPEEMLLLLELMKELGTFTGSNSDFADTYNTRFQKSVTAKGLKQMMNRWRYALEEQGVYFENRRSNGQRILDVRHSSVGDTSDESDEKTTLWDSCVPSVPCDPEKNEPCERK